MAIELISVSLKNLKSYAGLLGSWSLFMCQEEFKVTVFYYSLHPVSPFITLIIPCIPPPPPHLLSCLQVKTAEQE